MQRAALLNFPRVMAEEDFTVEVTFNFVSNRDDEPTPEQILDFLCVADTRKDIIARYPISRYPVLVERNRGMNRPDLIRTILLIIGLTLIVIGAAFALGAFRGLSGHGIGALIAGIAISFAVGVGLFALMYVSNREHDEKAHFAARENFKTNSGTSESAKDEP